MRTMMVMAAAVLLAGCAGHRVPRGGETITYKRSGGGLCLADYACPDYTMTLGPDGQGIFTGHRRVPAIGERRFRASPEQVRAFRAAVQPFRPEGGRLIAESNYCGHASWAGADDASDADDIDIRWQSALKSGDYLNVYTGCDPHKNAKMFKALYDAPKLLPIADLIGGNAGG